MEVAYNRVPAEAVMKFRTARRLFWSLTLDSDRVLYAVNMVRQGPDARVVVVGCFFFFLVI